MADILLDKVINNAVELADFIKWFNIPSDKHKNENFGCKCKQTEFIVYFLNFIHDELSRYGTCEVPQKIVTPKKIDKVLQCNSSKKKRSALFPGDDMQPACEINKSFSDPLNLSSSSILNKSGDASSTPNNTKRHSDNHISHLQDNYTSPISPIYKNSIPKVKKNTTSERGTNCFLLTDFIVNKKVKKKNKSGSGDSNSQENVSRRIKPTVIEKDKSSSFTQSGNSFNFQESPAVEHQSLSEGRNFLVREKLRLRANSVGNSTLLKIKDYVTDLRDKVCVNPEVELVSFKSQIDKLSDIYTCLFKNNFVLNITSEIHFLISLLFVKDFNVNILKTTDSEVGASDDNSSGATNVVKVINIFQSVHNLVYFSTRTLFKLKKILNLLDRPTIKLLAENELLQAFSPSLVNCLNIVLIKKQDRQVQNWFLSEQSNICFNLDTDNRSNFPNDTTFHAFRKQRDLFYEVLRIWERNQLQPEWSFGLSLGGKIRCLFGLSKDPVNYMHFCRLFKAQLLNSTSQNNALDVTEACNTLPFLSNVNNEKLQLLKNRLTSKNSSVGINSPPQFTSSQEFYKEFILTAANPSFNKHLCDILIVNILELNDTKFTWHDFDEEDPEVKKSFVLCLKSLNIMAKFLGFVETLPYKSEVIAHSENLVSTQINIRNKIYPNFDLREVLIASIRARTLTLTISWVCKYLSMLDYIALKLPYYSEVLRILFLINRRLNDSDIPEYNIYFTKINLGWLFELNHFPCDQFFNSLYELPEDFIEITYAKKDKECLDRMAIVDQNVIYTFCPFLEEIRKLLLTNTSNNRVAIKHITPLTAVESQAEINKKKLESQLEEAFLNGQPVSVRKTIEFVSERVASSCVKHICNTIVHDFKKTILADLKIQIETWKRDVNPEELEETLKSKAISYAPIALKKLIEECNKEISPISKRNIKRSLDSLLALDALQQTKEVSMTIALKYCNNRIKTWMNSHLTIAIFTKEFESEILQHCSSSKTNCRNKPLFALPTGGSPNDHNPSFPSAVETLENLRLHMIDIMEGKQFYTKDYLENLLETTYNSLTKRNDVNECITKSICTILVDFFLILVAHDCELSRHESVKVSFVKIWKLNLKQDLFQNLICPRNIMLLAQSPDSVSSWKSLAEFSAYLLEIKLVSCDEFAEQCAAAFRKDWDGETLKLLTLFLRTFLKRYEQFNRNIDKFTLLLEFLSEYCEDV